MHQPNWEWSPITACSFGVAHRLNGSSHTCGTAAWCFMNIWNGHIAQQNVNVDKALEVGHEQLKQFEASWPDSYFYRCISCSLDSCLTNKRNCWHIFITGFNEWCSVRLFEADAYHALIDMMTTLPKVLLGLLKKTLDLNTPLPAWDAVLENSLICVKILMDEQCLPQVTHTTG